MAVMNFALRTAAAASAPHHVNLLPWPLQCRLLVFRRLRLWAYVALALLTSVSIWYGWHALALFHTQGDLEAWRRRAAAVESIKSKNEELQRQLAQLQDRLARYGHLESEQIGFQLLATVSHCARTADARVTVKKLTFNSRLVPEEAQTPSSSTPPEKNAAPQRMREVRTLALAGVAVNNLAVAHFVSALRDAEVFQHVELKSSQGDKLTSSEGRAFLVECTF
jgi:Tfp pilus assembly protein PilN